MTDSPRAPPLPLDASRTMLRLYIANKNYSSWSLRPWLLMRELGIDFDEVLVPFGDPDQPSPFHAFSPSGRVPCLLDGDTVVWESLAIAETWREEAHEEETMAVGVLLADHRAAGDA